MPSLPVAHDLYAGAQCTWKDSGNVLMQYEVRR
jgi:hypothetical protein